MANYSLINSIVVVILLWFSATEAARNYKHDDDDGLCKSMVTTEDGYILSMQRLPADSFGSPAYKPPVLLQHALLLDGSTWLSISPNQSLGFILADNGYDVWIVNTHGMRYSQGHTSLCPKDPDYWNWSWDELAAYDLPATINYVHNQTAQKLHYVGHSLGTLTVLAALSQEKLLNVGAVALLGPIAYLGHTKSRMIKAFSKLFLAEVELQRSPVFSSCTSNKYKLQRTSDLLSLEATPMPKSVRVFWVAVGVLLKEICNKPGFNCSTLMSAITGPNCCITSSSENNMVLQPTATKNLIHLSQMVRRKNLAKYDYGNMIENMIHYKKLTPPTYDLIPNNIPLFIGYGENDYFTAGRDMQILLNKLHDHDADKLTVLKIPEYAHLDFVYGVNANVVVYDPLLDFLDSIDQ